MYLIIQICQKGTMDFYIKLKSKINEVENKKIKNLRFKVKIQKYNTCQFDFKFLNKVQKIFEKKFMQKKFFSKAKTKIFRFSVFVKKIEYR